MTQSIKSENAEILKFGGGRNTRATEDQIDPRECADGENFLLDPGNSEFKPRPPFDLVGTAPNAGTIRGFITLTKTDGTVAMAVQSNDTVYSIDSNYAFNSIGTVSSSANLRGRKEAFWAISDKVLISDISLQEEVYEWDGTTFQQSTFFESDGSTSFPTFRAKHIIVDNERALYGNIHDNGTNYPHLLIGSQRGNYAVVVASGLADSERGSASGIGAADPWFLPVNQLKPINGLYSAFGLIAVSQDNGAMEKIVGADATDFSMQKLYEGSGALGDEAMISTENDIIYGARGRIESLASTDKFGDVENDDLSFSIRDDISSYTGWTLAYNPATKRVYCFPDDASEVHVLFTELIGSGLSPWSKYKTLNSFGFQPTAVMLCRDPSSKLEYVFMGDSSGNVYRLDGTGTTGDAASSAINAWRTSHLINAPLDAKAHGIWGYCQHRIKDSATAKIKAIYSGENIQDAEKQVSLAAANTPNVYNGSAYYAGSFYYGLAQENRLLRRQFKIPGKGNAFQLRTEVESTGEWAIHEIGVRFDFAG